MPARSVRVPPAKLYHQDFFAWSEETARLLRERRFDDLDLVALVEEVESMGGSQWRELDSRLMVVIQHLLKWKFQPAKRSKSWRATLVAQRFELSRLLPQSPSLRTRLHGSVEEVYPASVRAAGVDTGLAEKAFPARCPFTPEQILNTDFLP